MPAFSQDTNGASSMVDGLTMTEGTFYPTYSIQGLEYNSETQSYQATSSGGETGGVPADFTGSFGGVYYIEGYPQSYPDANGTGYSPSAGCYYLNGTQMWGLDATGTGTNGVTGDMFYYNDLAGDPAFASTPIKMSWTPPDGWVLLQAPEGVTIDPASLTAGNRFYIEDGDGQMLFDSDNFVQGTAPSSSALDAWSNMLSGWYASHPEYTNNYSPHSDLLSLSGGGAGSGSGGSSPISTKVVQTTDGLLLQTGEFVLSPFLSQ